VGAYKKVGKGANWESFRYLGTVENRTGDINETVSGQALLIYPKYYISGRAGRHLNHGCFLGLRTNIQSYKVNMKYYIDQQNIKGQSIVSVLTFGSHQQFGACFTWGVEWGFGFYLDRYKDVEYKWVYDQWTRKTTAFKRVLEVSGGVALIDVNVGVLF
jgi:hypothetical protein